MEIISTPLLTPQTIQGFGFNQANAISIFDNTLGNNGLNVISNIFGDQINLQSGFYDNIKIDLISILNEVKDNDILSIKDLLKLELAFSILEQQDNPNVSLLDFFAVLYLLSVLIF